MKEFLLIEKETIDGIQFPDGDVLRSTEARQARALKIHRATNLGNIENYKVHILFEDGDSKKKVFTTIWAQTHEKVVLKKGVAIPVKRILDIQF